MGLIKPILLRTKKDDGGAMSQSGYNFYDCNLFVMPWRNVVSWILDVVRDIFLKPGFRLFQTTLNTNSAGMVLHYYCYSTSIDIRSLHNNDSTMGFADFQGKSSIVVVPQCSEDGMEGKEWKEQRRPCSFPHRLACLASGEDTPT